MVVNYICQNPAYGIPLNLEMFEDNFTDTKKKPKVLFGSFYLAGGGEGRGRGGGGEGRGGYGDVIGFYIEV